MNLPLRCRATLLLLVTGSLLPCWLMAQEPTLRQVERFASAGRAEEARTMLLEWWENDRAGASRRDAQLGLWLRGRLTVDPGQAARDFQRLAIEYPGGPYTDHALFRLAQGAFAHGDRERARAYLTSLTRDYPGSPVREQAEAWMSEASRAGPPPVITVVETPRSEEVQAADVPVGDSVVDSTPPTAQPGQDASSPAAGTDGRYAVQLGAFLDESRAGALLRRAEEAGLDVRLVRVQGSRLLHVRVGRFDSSAQASVFFRSVTARGFSAAVVRDAQQEEPVGG